MDIFLRKPARSIEFLYLLLCLVFIPAYFYSQLPEHPEILLGFHIRYPAAQQEFSRRTAGPAFGKVLYDAADRNHAVIQFQSRTVIVKPERQHRAFCQPHGRTYRICILPEHFQSDGFERLLRAVVHVEMQFLPVPFHAPACMRSPQRLELQPSDFFHT